MCTCKSNHFYKLKSQILQSRNFQRRMDSQELMETALKMWLQAQPNQHI